MQQVERYVERDEPRRQRWSRCAKRSHSCPRQAYGSRVAVVHHRELARCALPPAPPLRIGPVAGRDAACTRAAARAFLPAAVLAAAAIVAIAVLGIEVVRQQHRIDDLAAEMRRDPMQHQALAARSKDSHVIDLGDRGQR